MSTIEPAPSDDGPFLVWLGGVLRKVERVAAHDLTGDGSVRDFGGLEKDVQRELADALCTALGVVEEDDCPGEAIAEAEHAVWDVTEELLSTLVHQLFLAVDRGEKVSASVVQRAYQAAGVIEMLGRRAVRARDEVVRLIP